MKKQIMLFGVLSGIMAFAFCLTGGIWILSHVGFSRSDDAVWTGLGLYFIGKALFVGPMLIIISVRNHSS